MRSGQKRSDMKVIKQAKKEAETASRFIVVGVINTIVGCSIMFGLYNLAGTGYWVSSAANFVFTSILSYILNKKFTFRHSGDVTGSAVRFAVNIALCYLLAYGIARPVAEQMLSGYSPGVRDNAAMIVGLILFTVFNYLGQRFFAFRKRG